MPCFSVIRLLTRVEGRLENGNSVVLCSKSGQPLLPGLLISLQHPPSQTMDRWETPWRRRGVGNRPSERDAPIRLLGGVTWVVVVTHLQHVQQRCLSGVVEAEEQQLGVLVEQAE